MGLTITDFRNQGAIPTKIIGLKVARYAFLLDYLSCIPENKLWLPCVKETIQLCHLSCISAYPEPRSRALLQPVKVGPGGAQALPTRPGAPPTSTMKSDGAVKSHKQERLQIGNACSVFL